MIGRRCLWTGHRGDFAHHRHLFDVSDSSVDDIIVSTPGSFVDHQPGPPAASRKRAAGPVDVDFAVKQKHQKIFDPHAAVVAAAAAVADDDDDDDDYEDYEDVDDDDDDDVAVEVAAAAADDDDEDDDDVDDDSVVMMYKAVLVAVRDSIHSAIVAVAAVTGDLQALVEVMQVTRAETFRETQGFAMFMIAVSRQFITIAEQRACLNVHAATADDDDDDDDDDDKENDDDEGLRYADIPVHDVAAAVREAALDAVGAGYTALDALDDYRRAVYSHPASPTEEDATINAVAEFEEVMDYAEDVLAIEELLCQLR